MSRGRLRTPTTWIAAFAGLAVAAAIALAMAPANAEASKTTTTLTLTGMVSSTCDLGTGGKVSYVAPGGTVTLKAALAGISVKLPGLLGLPGQTITLDSSTVASFVDTVVIDGDNKHPKTLDGTNKITLSNVTKTHRVDWTAKSVTLLPALGLGKLGIAIPLSADNVGLPAGAELEWSGKIVPSKNTDCGIAVSVPTTKVHAGSHTVTVPGANVSVPNPVPSITKALGGLPGLGGKSSTNSNGGGQGGGSKAGGNPINYTPPALTVPEQVMPRAVNYGGGGIAPPAAGGVAGGSINAPAAKVTSTAAPAPSVSPAGNIKPANTTDMAQRDRLGGAQLPVLLAIVAILALASVTAMYAKQYLLRR